MHRIKLLGTLPRCPVIALSGGVDSMAVADFIGRTRHLQCAFFNHGTTVSREAEQVVTKFCQDRGYQLHVGVINTGRPSDLSQEEHWRNERYRFLDSLNSDVITAHHLDDCVETYIWGSLHGTAKVIPYRRNRVIRPFLLTTKASLINWAETNNVPWIDDSTNSDDKYTRNYIRTHIVPHAFEVNPGLHKVVARKVEERYNSQELDIN